MNWEVEYTDDFDQLWSGLTEEEQACMTSTWNNSEMKEK